MQPALESSEVPMGCYRPLAEINRGLPRDAILVAEGWPNCPGAHRPR